MTIVQRVTADLLSTHTDGRLRPFINHDLALREAPAAQTYIASNAQVGKIVLMV